MDDGQQSTAWKVALMWPLSNGAVALLSSDAQPSRIIDIRPKSLTQNVAQMPSSRLIWLNMGTKPVSDTSRFWIFLSCDNNGAIDVFTRRVGRWKVSEFVAALWICRKCSGVGRTAQIRWGTIDVEIEPRGAESRSILPRYVLKNGNTFECNVPIMRNPLYSHTSTSRTKTSSFSSASPFNYHFLHRHINLP